MLLSVNATKLFSKVGGKKKEFKNADDGWENIKLLQTFNVRLQLHIIRSIRLPLRTFYEAKEREREISKFPRHCVFFVHGEDL